MPCIAGAQFIEQVRTERVPVREGKVAIGELLIVTKSRKGSAGERPFLWHISKEGLPGDTVSAREIMVDVDGVLIFVVPGRYRNRVVHTTRLNLRTGNDICSVGKFCVQQS